jgi:hypothetical protein
MRKKQFVYFSLLIFFLFFYSKPAGATIFPAIGRKVKEAIE